ncbi:MAG: hypothetical protein [Cressdnaviricota sp.]|nr:MAG: hypothetical protein [Cressdnaviricota sp.]
MVTRRTSWSKSSSLLRFHIALGPKGAVMMIKEGFQSTKPPLNSTLRGYRSRSRNSMSKDVCLVLMSSKIATRWPSYPSNHRRDPADIHTPSDETKCPNSNAHLVFPIPVGPDIQITFGGVLFLSLNMDETCVKPFENFTTQDIDATLSPSTISRTVFPDLNNSTVSCKSFLLPYAKLKK